MKRFGILLLSLFLFFPIDSYALVDDYKDVVHERVNVEQEENIVNIYLFYGDGCPHCAREEKFLKH